MRGRSPLQSLAASPTMVGAITTLIVIVAVFLAYNASNGLPFVPVYRVSVEVPNAARIVRNNEVRIGGHRVGVVESIEAVRESDASATAAADDEVAQEAAGDTSGVVARMNLKLDKTAEPLPVDSIFRVRYKSTFGLKFVEIIRGTGEGAPEGFRFDGTDDGAICDLPIDIKTFSDEIPESAKNGCFQAQTEFDDIGNTFDRPTRANSRINLEGFGNAFAGRGASLNDAIGSLKPLFQSLKPVAEALADPETRFSNFFSELGDAARIVAPVAAEQAEMFTNLAITFAAISEDVDALQATISEGVPTLETGIRILPAQRIFLREFGVLSRELRPGVNDLRATLPVLNRAITVGTPVLKRTVGMNRRLRGVLRELNQLVTQPSTKTALLRLRQTFQIAQPLAEHVVPAQTVCNYWSYWFTHVPNALSDPDQVGTSFRQSVVGAPRGPIGIDAIPGPGEFPVTVPGEVQTPLAGYSGLQANARAGPQPAPADNGSFKPFELPIAYGQPYFPAGQLGTNDDCQGGQNGYMLGRLQLPGQANNNPANAFSDLPGSRGPTTVFHLQNGKRILVDSRNPSRAPDTWGGLEP